MSLMLGGDPEAGEGARVAAIGAMASMVRCCFNPLIAWAAGGQARGAA
ncbi:MAG: hypothetical protein KJO75_17405 [Dactylosporangium sp.]|nr:hypothetical protein [Dactylosporangium sp.]